MAMSDSEIRTLERESRQGGTSVRYARALERAGQRDAALAVLLAQRDDADVRREIARFPAWTHRDGDAGRSRYLDVAGIQGPPILRWHRHGNATALLASPLGLVTSSADTFVLDPETGEERARIDGIPVALRGADLLVRRGEDLAIVDLVTTQETRRLERIRHESAVVAADKLVALSRPGLLETHDLATGERLWSRSIAESAGPRPDPVIVADLVLVADGRGHVGFDLVTGRDRGLWPFLGGWDSWCCGDPRGVVGNESTSTAEYDLSGSTYCRVPRGLAPRAVTPGWIVASTFSRGAPGKLILVDRATGQTRGSGYSPGLVAATRDTIYVGDPATLRALAYDRAPLWKAPLGQLTRGRIRGLIPAPHRLYVVAEDEGIFCLEAGPLVLTRRPNPPDFRSWFRP